MMTVMIHSYEIVNVRLSSKPYFEEIVRMYWPSQTHGFYQHAATMLPEDVQELVIYSSTLVSQSNVCVRGKCSNL